MKLEDLALLAWVLDEPKLDRNIQNLHRKLACRGVKLRPHVKTAKCMPVVQRAMGSIATGITVSTLREAEYFLDRGIKDILYAVGIAPGKLAQVADLQRRGADIVVVLDSVAAAAAVAEWGKQGLSFPALIEIDSDGHRAGVRPGDPVLLEIGRTLAASPGAVLRGVMTHAGGSYDCRGVDSIRAMAEQERRAVVGARDLLAAAGLPCPIVSVGSTPTAVHGESFEGVTEVRAGVFVFHDLVMAGLEVCALDDLALSVLTTVIGHQKDKGWIITDGGWMALSRDRGTGKQPTDQGYGVVCDLDGRPLESLIVIDASQEHGIVARRVPGGDRPQRASRDSLPASGRRVPGGDRPQRASRDSLPASERTPRPRVGWTPRASRSAPVCASCPITLARRRRSTRATSWSEVAASSPPSGIASEDGDEP